MVHQSALKLHIGIYVVLTILILSIIIISGYSANKEKYLDLICYYQQLFLVTMLMFYSLKLVSQLFRQDRCMKLTNDNFYKYNFMCNYIDTGVPFRSTALLLFAPYSAQAMIRGINFRSYVYAWLYIRRHHFDWLIDDSSLYRCSSSCSSIMILC